MSDDMTSPTERPERPFTLRKSTRLEIGLFGALLVNVVMIVWFFATMAAKVDQISKTVETATSAIDRLRNDAAEGGVLRYRLDQAEAAIRELRLTQPRR